jgi:hypothetical protein
LLASKWEIQPVNLVPVGHGIVDAIAAKIRKRRPLRMFIK